MALGHGSCASEPRSLRWLCRGWPGSGGGHSWGTQGRPCCWTWLWQSPRAGACLPYSTRGVRRVGAPRSILWLRPARKGDWDVQSSEKDRGQFSLLTSDGLEGNGEVADAEVVRPVAAHGGEAAQEEPVTKAQLPPHTRPHTAQHVRTRDQLDHGWGRTHHARFICVRVEMSW